METTQVQAASARFNALLEEDWAARMVAAPSYATYVGFPGQNHRWADLSPEALAQEAARRRTVLKEVKAIPREALNPSEQLSWDLICLDLEDQISGDGFGEDFLLLNQMDGPQRDIPSTLASQPARTPEDYAAILARLKAIPLYLGQAQALLEEGLSKGITPPKAILGRVPQQVADLVTPGEPLASPLGEVFAERPESIPLKQWETIVAEGSKTLNDAVFPAFQGFQAFLEGTYIPGARESIGFKELPQGAAWYQDRVRHYTTTDMSPDEIHAIGLKEVERIQGEMAKVMGEAGFKGDFAEFSTMLRTDPRFYYQTPEELLRGYRDISKRIDPGLIRLFKTLPRLPYGVEAIPDHIAPSQTTAYYHQGSLDAARPGIFFANTYDLKSRPTWEMEALTLHEAVPGHHLQIALAQELDDLPMFRQEADFTAYIEGWALYAESLGGELGLYQDPYSRYGQLTYEMWRAIRLVVDTGLHAKGWTRDQAIDFFKAHSPKPEHDIIVEVDRYIAWPGQALAYKVGELKIQSLRRHAEEALGPDFDLRSFHDALLKDGALPLDILEARMRAWIDSEDKTHR